MVFAERAVDFFARVSLQRLARAPRANWGVGAGIGSALALCGFAYLSGESPGGETASVLRRKYSPTSLDE